MPLPNTLVELNDSIADDYALNLSIPSRVKDNIPAELIGILDWNNDQLLRNQMILRDIIHPSRAPDSVLHLFSMQFGLPVPRFATATNLRKLAVKAAYINSRRNTVLGWSTFLSLVLGSTLTVTVSMTHRVPDQFTLGVVDLQFSSIDEMQTAGDVGTDQVNYLFSEALITRNVLVTVAGTGQTSEFQAFVQATGIYFLPMIEENPFYLDLIHVRIRLGFHD